MLIVLTFVLEYELPDVNFQRESCQEFSMEELKYALSLKKDSSPGEDGIKYSMLRMIPEERPEDLLNLFTKILGEESTIPDDWKTQIIWPMPKAGKNPNIMSVWRPIILSSNYLNP